MKMPHNYNDKMRKSQMTRSTFFCGVTSWCNTLKAKTKLAKPNLYLLIFVQRGTASFYLFSAQFPIKSLCHQLPKTGKSIVYIFVPYSHQKKTRNREFCDVTNGTKSCPHSLLLTPQQVLVSPSENVMSSPTLPNNCKVSQGALNRGLNPMLSVYRGERINT